MNPSKVVAAIIKKNNLYLIVQRNKNKHLGLKWEFPGGKVQSGETLTKALIREIKEELNIVITVHKKIAVEISHEVIKQTMGTEMNLSSISATVDDISKEKVIKYL